MQIRTGMVVANAPEIPELSFHHFRGERDYVSIQFDIFTDGSS
jgi:hypothetical protein